VYVSKFDYIYVNVGQPNMCINLSFMHTQSNLLTAEEASRLELREGDAFAAGAFHDATHIVSRRGMCVFM